MFSNSALLMQIVRIAQILVAIRFGAGVGTIGHHRKNVVRAIERREIISPPSFEQKTS
jgi:hypothetical protein